MRILLLLTWVILCSGTLAQAQTSSSSATAHVRFSWQNHYAKTVFNLPVYSNVHGQSYSVSVLRYYVGNISLHREDGYSHILPGYHLIVHDDQADDSYQPHDSIRVSGLPPGTYTSLSFTLGVDSVDNVGGPREGHLDPLLGMYWTWSTGYIFFKMEGRSSASPQPKNIIEYHLGGYQAPFNNIQRIRLPLRRPLVAGKDAISLEIAFDLGAFVDQDGGIDFSLTPSVTDVKTAAPFMRRLQGAFHVR